MRRDAKAETRAINAKLWRDWDPIGREVPEDEFQSYVLPVYKLLIQRKPRTEFESYPRWAADENITVSVPEERLRLVVDQLLALGVGSEEGKRS